MSSADISKNYSYSITDAETSYKNLCSTIKNLNNRSQQLRYSSALFLWLASISLLLIGWLLLGGVLNLPVFLRLPLIIIWLGCAIWTGYLFVFKALTKHASMAKMAFRLENYYPDIQDRLISSLQLWPELQENKYGYSHDFIAKTIQEAHESLNRIDKKAVIQDDLKKFKSSVLALTGLILPLVVLIAIFPSVFMSSMHTFAHPFAGEVQGIPVEIAGVTPGNHRTTPGESVDFTAEATGTIKAEAILNYRAENMEWKSRLLSKREIVQDKLGKSFFSTTLQNIRESLEYYVSIADVKSQQYSITVVQRPIITELQLELQYPKYTGISSQPLEINEGNISALLGTKVSITAMSSKDIASAFIVYDDKSQNRMEIAKNQKLTGVFSVQRSGTYYLSITDTEGYTNSDPIKYSISAVADQPPGVDIVKPGEDVEIGDEMALPLQIEAQDDYGIAAMKLHYQIEGEEKKHAIQVLQLRKPDKVVKSRTFISVNYDWDLKPLELFPEDVVSYYAEAVDMDNISGPNTGKSRVFTLRFPSLYDMFKDTEIEQEAQQMEMEDIQSKQDDVKKMVDDVISKLKKEKELSLEEKKELERATELQRQIEEKTEKLAEEINKTVKKMEQNPLFDMKAMEKIQELRDLMDELATEEMKQIMRKLSEALEKINPSQQQQDLMKANFKQEEFMEKMDRMIDLFKKMKLQQKLEVAANQAKELVRQQTEILEQSENLAKENSDSSEAQAKMKVLADREMRVKNQTEQLLADLDETSEEMSENIPEMAEMLKQIKKQADQNQIPNDLQCASSELSNSNPKDSIPCQKKALSGLSGLQQNLQSAVESMQGQDVNEITSELRNIIRNSLYISHRHEEVMKAAANFRSESRAMLPAEKKMLDSLAADEIDLAENTKKVAMQLRDVSHKTSNIPTELVWNMVRAADGMNRAASAMEDKLPTLVKPIQRNTLAKLNKIIDDLLKSIDQINDQAMPMSGMDDYMQQLRQLAEQQSQLNKSSQDAESMLRRQGTTPSMESLMEQLALEQSLIREAAERLAEKLDELSQTLGSLGEVAREMQEVEENLRKGHLSGNTIDKQKRILTRLLDYEKSLKREEFSKKRESKTGREYTVEKPSSILPEDATKIQQNLEKMTTPLSQEQWPGQYRELIKMYYKALSNTVRTQSGVNR